MNKPRSHLNERDFEDMKVWLRNACKELKATTYTNNVHLLFLNRTFISLKSLSFECDIGSFMYPS